MLALRVATFLRDTMITRARAADPDPQRGPCELARVYHEGATRLDGTLDDYAFCAHAMLELSEATGDRAWWDLGAGLLAGCAITPQTPPSGAPMFRDIANAFLIVQKGMCAKLEVDEVGAAAGDQHLGSRRRGKVARERPRNSKALGLRLTLLVSNRPSS